MAQLRDLYVRIAMDDDLSRDDLLALMLDMKTEADKNADGIIDTAPPDPGPGEPN